MTNEELADLIRESHKETQQKLHELEISVNHLEEGQLSQEEKENLFVVVDHINKRLENETLGKQDITLLRSEYDSTAVAAKFPNRFEVANGALAE